MQFSMYLPVKPKFITQPFGYVGNVDYYNTNGIPIVGHNGCDLLAYHGQPVYASHDGIAYYETDEKQGDGVVICTEQTFDYKGGQAFFKSIYWHFLPINILSSYALSNYAGAIGYTVKAGDLIGFADSTGLSTGDHLHWSLKPQNPPTANDGPLYARSNIEQSNGYLGCIDPMPYWNNLFAEDLPIKHTFTTNIVLGSTGVEVVALQRTLKQLGLFNANITGYYGPITQAAVYAFQQKYVAKDWWSSLQVKINQGTAVRSLTIAALNNLV